MITIFTESGSQRRYAARFAEKVYEAAYETTDEPAGKGLVIIGNLDQPHPVMLVKKYLDIAKENERATDTLNFGPILNQALIGWEEAEEQVRKEAGVDIESIVYVAPLPLEGAVYSLYMTAKQVEFDEAKVRQQFAELSVKEVVDSGFDKFDWVIYLPPRNAIDKVIREVLPAAMKAQKIGFFKRALARGAVFTFKPLIKDAMEAVRKGMLYESILRSTSDLNEGDIKAFSNAYLEALMPKGSLIPGKKKDRSLEAIRQQKIKNEEYAKDPFIVPEERIELDISLYPKYEGEYVLHKRPSAKIFIKEGSLNFQRGNNKPHRMEPASETLFVADSGRLTIEFQEEKDSHFEKMELRRERWRRVFSREF